MTTGEITDIAGLVISALAFASGILVIWLTKRSLDSLTAQLRSQSQHTIMEAHKSLFMEILKDGKLLAIVAPDNEDAFRLNLLTSMLINHCARIFKDFGEGLADKDEFDSFVDDARDMFAISAVKARWPEVRRFHSKKFQSFIEGHVLGPADAMNPALETISVEPETDRAAVTY